MNYEVANVTQPLKMRTTIFMFFVCVFFVCFFDKESSSQYIVKWKRLITTFVGIGFTYRPRRNF